MYIMRAFIRLKQHVKQININNYSWVLVHICNNVVKFSFISLHQNGYARTQWWRWRKRGAQKISFLSQVNYHVCIAKEERIFSIKLNVKYNLLFISILQLKVFSFLSVYWKFFHWFWTEIIQISWMRPPSNACNRQQPPAIARVLSVDGLKWTKFGFPRFLPWRPFLYIQTNYSQSYICKR